MDISKYHYFNKHKSTLDTAIYTCRSRNYWSAFTESPSAKLHPQGAAEQGKADFQNLLNKPFLIDKLPEIGRTGHEISPYTQQPLGIDYPKLDIDSAFTLAKHAMQSWKKTPYQERAGLCLEMAFALEKQTFLNAHATMHTAGQSYLMAFSGSGANALDRGVEGIAYAFKALSDVPANATWTKSFGKAGEISLNKTYQTVPRGVACVVCCATFPLWNAYPAIFANLMTGNPVIIKPHPNGILPVAIAVKRCREILQLNNYDPNLILMAPDTQQNPITKELLTHKDCAIIDYTGSQRFGQWIEKHCNKLTYTETAGCNSVVIESTNDVRGLINALANALAGFSAQMCTSPQNIHLSENGFQSNEGHISFQSFCDMLGDAIRDKTKDDTQAAAICAAIQSPQSLLILDQFRQRFKASSKILLDSKPYTHPEFTNARTATPMICVVDSLEKEYYQQELFAPISFVIKEENAETALKNATLNARKYGAISSYLYSSDADFLEQGKEQFADAGASVWCNMTSAMPINFAAAYSDYHVTGLNPAGNACLTDLAFVTNRFRIIQYREPAE